MSIVAEYLSPMNHWLHLHPNFALVFAFLVAFAESLAIVGMIIPGALTMTAVGILAGSEVMRLDLTIICTSIGAFFGDTASYILGYLYSHKLYKMWPFSRYPNLINYGKDYFNRHGKKSVLIGRFIGPLRPVIPLIAGMLNMPKLEFIVSNFLSGIGWSILYLTPGYMIGAASTQLSSDSAQRLFLFVLIVLATIWVASHFLRSATQHLQQSLVEFINRLWLLAKSKPLGRALLGYLTNKSDKKQQYVMRLLMFWLINLGLCSLLFYLQAHAQWLHKTNLFISVFLNTLRTPALDKINLIVTFILSPQSLALFSLFIISQSLCRQDWRFLKYWLSLNLLFVGLLGYGFPQSTSFKSVAIGNATIFIEKFPDMPLCFATALFTFFIFHLAKNHKNLARYLNHGLGLLLTISGFSRLYLGDNSLSALLCAFSLGYTIGLLHWILYRRKHNNPFAIHLTLIISALIFLGSALYSYYQNFERFLSAHTPKTKQYTLNLDTWWYQDEPILPRYTTNRLGKRIGVFNIQYAGSIAELEKRLNLYGWHKQSRSFLYSLLIHTEERDFTESLPFMGQLYLNKLPALTMSYTNLDNQDLYIIRLWRSNYHLMHYQEPIWLGNILLSRKKHTDPMTYRHKFSDENTNLFMHILPAVHDYQITHMPLTDPQIKTLPHEIPADVLIIKN